MSNLSDEDKQKKQTILMEINALREKYKALSEDRNLMGEKRKEIGEKRRKIEQELKGSGVDDQIKEAENAIKNGEKKIESLQMELKVQNSSEGDIHNDDIWTVSAERKVEELRRKLVEIKEKQRVEEEKLQSLESGQIIPIKRELEELREQLIEAEKKQRLEEEKLQSLENNQLVSTKKTKGFLASLISAVRNFINRKSIAMEKRQVEINIAEEREMVNVATNNVENIEAKLKDKENRAKFHRSRYEQEKLEAEITKVEEEKINTEIEKISEQIKKRKEENEKIKTEKAKLEEERINSEIQQIRENIEKQKKEKKELEAKRQEISNRPKEERERLKQEYEQARKELEQVKKKLEQIRQDRDDITKQIRDKQEQVKKIDPNHYLTSEQLDALLDYVTGGAYKSTINQRGKTAQESKTGTTPKTPTSDSKTGGTKDTRTNTEIKRENFKDKLKEGVGIYINNDLKNDPQFEEQEVQTFSTPLSDREQEGEDFVKE